MVWPRLTIVEVLKRGALHTERRQCGIELMLNLTDRRNGELLAAHGLFAVKSLNTLHESSSVWSG